MPNQASHAGHIAERTCVICRKKQAQMNLLRFVIFNSKFVIDPHRSLAGKGYYCCQEAECLKKLEKWIQKYRKRKQKKV